MDKDELISFGLVPVASRETSEHRGQFDNSSCEVHQSEPETSVIYTMKIKHIVDGINWRQETRWKNIILIAADGFRLSFHGTLLRSVADYFSNVPLSSPDAVTQEMLLPNVFTSGLLVLRDLVYLGYALISLNMVIDVLIQLSSIEPSLMIKETDPRREEDLTVNEVSRPFGKRKKTLSLSAQSSLLASKKRSLRLKQRIKRLFTLVSSKRRQKIRFLKGWKVTDLNTCNIDPLPALETPPESASEMSPLPRGISSNVSQDSSFSNEINTVPPSTELISPTMSELSMSEETPSAQEILKSISPVSEPLSVPEKVTSPSEVLPLPETLEEPSPPSLAMESSVEVIDLDDETPTPSRITSPVSSPVKSLIPVIDLSTPTTSPISSPQRSPRTPTRKSPRRSPRTPTRRSPKSPRKSPKEFPRTPPRSPKNSSLSLLRCLPIESSAPMPRLTRITDTPSRKSLSETPPRLTLIANESPNKSISRSFPNYQKSSSPVKKSVFGGQGNRRARMSTFKISCIKKLFCKAMRAKKAIQKHSAKH